jgi:hypothetical protein
MSRFLLPDVNAWKGHDRKDDVLLKVTYNLKERKSCRNLNGYLWPRSRYQGMTEGILFEPVLYRQPKLIGGWEGRKGSSYQLLYKIEGQCKDPNDTAYGNCTAILFRTSDNLKVDSVVADASGYFLLYTPYITDAHFVVAFNSDGTVAGVTVNTLIPVV